MKRDPRPDDVNASRQAVERLLSDTGLSLDDETLWAPPPDLADALVTAAASDPPPSPSRRHRRWWPAAVAGLAAAVVFAGVVLATRAQPPDWTLPLAATDLAPGVTAEVSGWNEPAGTRITLAVDALPPAPDGYFYELWFSADDIHISGGTFREPTDVELWVGVARRDFPRVWITLEPIDDDESPSGDTVLDSV